VVVPCINELPPSPNFVSRSRANLFGVIVCITTEPILVTVVMLTCVEGIVWVVSLILASKALFSRDLRPGGGVVSPTRYLLVPGVCV
jgi:hypothetical protein